MGAVEAPDRWEADVLLTDGGTMHLRPIRPGDRGLVEAFHARQSPESIYYRYFSPRPVLSEADLDRLTRVDHLDRMAFIGLIGTEMVGVARYDRYPTTQTAEVAFFTDENQRGRGVATILLEYLAAAAREAGLSGFVAQVLPENRRMLSVFTRAGFEVQTRFADGIIEVDLGIEPTEEARRLVAERARSAHAHSVERMLAPKVVAVIGASRRSDALGRLVFTSIRSGGFTGKVVPVNPAADRIDGVRAYPSVRDVPEDVDVAVVCVPRQVVPSVVSECARRHVHALVVITAGFADADAEGVRLERSVVARARRWGMRLLGPNSMGVINTSEHVSLRATFVGVHPLAGSIGVSSQSGTLGAAIIEHLARRGLGISTFVSLGNQGDVTNSDLMGYWQTDPATSLVVLYLESFGDPAGFARSVRSLARVKPVIAVKSGGILPIDTSASGLPVTADVDALIAQTGMIRVDTLAELLDVAVVLSRQPTPKGRRLAILSNARSPAHLAMEAALSVGLEIADVEVDGRANPVDLGFDVSPDVFARTLETLCARPDVDAVLVLCTPTVPEAIDEFAPRIVDVAARAPVPVVATYLGMRSSAAGVVGRDVPVFSFPEEAVRALARAAHYGEWLCRDPGRLPDTAVVDAESLAELLGGAVDSTFLTVDPDLAAGVLASAGVSVLARRRVSTTAEATAAAEELGWPIVLKAGGVAHPAKTEAGGVAVDIHDRVELEHAFARMRSLLGAAMDEAIVQHMAGPGVDVRVGLVRSDLIGAVLTLSVDADFVAQPIPTAVQVVPCSDTDARSLIVRSGLAEVLGDVAVESVVDLLQRLSALADAAPEIMSIVLDPVIISAAEVAVTDVRMNLEKVSPEDRLPVRRLDVS